MAIKANDGGTAYPRIGAQEGVGGRLLYSGVVHRDRDRFIASIKPSSAPWHAYALGDGPEPFPCFLILEYVHGQKRSYAELRRPSDEQRTRFYASLANVFMQLRRIESESHSIDCLTT